jgi:WD40 repeat protein
MADNQLKAPLIQGQPSRSPAVANPPANAILTLVSLTEQKEASEFDPIYQHISTWWDDSFSTKRFDEKKGIIYKRFCLTPDSKYYFFIYQNQVHISQAGVMGRWYFKYHISDFPLTHFEFYSAIDNVWEVAIGDENGVIQKYLYKEFLKTIEDFETRKLNKEPEIVTPSPISHGIQASEGPITFIKYNKYDGHLYCGGSRACKMSSDWESQIVIDKPVNYMDFYGEVAIVACNNVEILNGEVDKLDFLNSNCVAISEKWFAASSGKNVKVWNRQNGQIKSFVHEGHVAKMTFIQEENALFAFAEGVNGTVFNLISDIRSLIIRDLNGVNGGYLLNDGLAVLIINAKYIEKYIIPPWPEDYIIKGKDKILRLQSNETFLVSLNENSASFTKSGHDQSTPFNISGKVSNIFLSQDQLSFYLVVDKKRIFIYSTIDLSSKEINSSDFDIESLAITNDNTILAYSGIDQLVIWNLSTNLLHRKYTGFHARVKKPLKNLDIRNNNIYFSFCGTNYGKLDFSDQANKTQTLITDFFGEVGAIKLSPDENIILKSVVKNQSKDYYKNFKVYNSRKLMELKNCSYHKDLVTEFYFTPDNVYFYVSSLDGSVSIWSRDTLCIMTAVFVGLPISTFAMSCDGKYMYLGNGTDIYAHQDPLNTENVRVFGPIVQCPHDYLLCIKRLKAQENWDIEKKLFGIVFREDFNQCIISPSGMNLLHFYAKFEYEDYYTRGLENGSFHNSKQQNNPLTILFNQDNSELALTTLDIKYAAQAKDRFCMNFFNNKTLVLLNNRGYSGVESFYDEIYKVFPADKTLPKYASLNATLPTKNYSKIIDPIPADLMAVTNAKEGIPVVFYAASIGVCMISGSKDSLDLVKSLRDCPNQEIFNTKYVSMLLFDKWNAVKWFMLFQALVYVSFLICYSLFIILNLEVFMVIAFVLNCILVLYEVVQMSFTGISYWEDLWNLIDLARFVLFTLLFFLTFWYEVITLPYLEVLVILIAWVKGLTYFRIFNSTRYLVYLMFEVVKDMISFITMTFYAIVGLSLMLYTMKNFEDKSAEGQEYGKFLAYTYMNGIGDYGTFDFDVGKFELTSFMIFSLTSIVNTIIMMNLLISIIGDTYDRVQQGIMVADLKQLAEMIVEIESLMFWNYEKTNKVHMQRLINKFEDNNEGLGVWQGKVRELKGAILVSAENQNRIVLELKAKIENFESNMKNIDAKLDMLLEKK